MMYERISTRPGFENDEFWKEGYRFHASEVSDVLVCEKVGNDNIGRMHLRSSVKEIPGFYAQLSDKQKMAALTYKGNEIFPIVEKSS